MVHICMYATDPNVMYPIQMIAAETIPFRIIMLGIYYRVSLETPSSFMPPINSLLRLSLASACSGGSPSLFWLCRAGCLGVSPPLRCLHPVQISFQQHLKCLVASREQHNIVGVDDFATGVLGEDF